MVALSHEKPQRFPFQIKQNGRSKFCSMLHNSLALPFKIFHFLKLVIRGITLYNSDHEDYAFTKSANWISMQIKFQQLIAIYNEQHVLLYCLPFVEAID